MSKLFHVIEKAQNSQAESQLFDALGFEKPHPYAALYAAQDINASQVVRLSPISIKTTHNDALVVGGGESLDITDNEHKQITDLLEAHFASYDIAISHLSQHDWLLTHDKTIITTPLHDVINQSIYPLLPEGEDKAFWHRIITECQMLLFQIPQLQERQDKLDINGVWLWGESSYTRPHRQTVVITDDEAILRSHANLPGIMLIKYTGALDKAFLNTLTDWIIYVSLLTAEDKRLLNKIKYRKKIQWQGCDDQLSLGHQDENNQKKKNKRFSSAFSFITTLGSYLCGKRYKHRKRLRNRS